MKSRNLNFTYRLVWSNVKQMFIAVAEFARTRKKRCRTVVLAATLLTAPFTTLAQAQQLPTGGQIVAGQGHIASTGTTMIVTQNTANMAVNWQNFSIGQGNTVNFVQPSASAVALNRVLGSDVSVIQGALNANGKIFLINPNGALFTPTAQVNVGSLLASTLNISTADFMAGNYRFEGISSNAITNQGNITTTAGGTVALIAAKIVNSGQINAPQGNVLMAAGSKVTLDLGGPVKIQIDEGALNTLIEQGGGIRSDGGLVYLTAKAAGELATSVINHTGITEARTLATGGKGEIYLLADMKRGETIVSGKLDASAPQGGDGGFIETSAATVTVRDGVQVTTAAPYGKTGKWLIDPVNITIAASGGDVTGATLATALQTTNVTLDTSGTGACTGAACSALSGSDGDIFVKDNITVTGGTVDTTLTLKAERNIVIDAGKTLSRTGSYKLHTILWSDSDNSGSGYVFITDGSTISTNGGKIVMAGGLDDGANGGTAGDGIPDGYATSATANYSGVSIGRLNNAATAGTTIQSGGGDILIRGKSTATTGSGMGISFSHSGTLNAGTGTLTMEGISSSYHGIELSAWIDGAPSGSYLDINANAVNISGTTSNANYHGLAGSQLNSKYTRVTAGAGGISLYGENTANSNKGVEISLNATTTGGGDITAETPGLFSFYNGSNAHSINAGSGDIVIKSNTLNVGSNNTISGSGTLTVEPYAAGTTIGIAGGTGTLQLPASYFSTNFVNGFSGITVGNAAAGAITVGSTALSYNDPLTIKTGNSIFFGGTSSVSGNNNALTLWTRAGGNDAADDGIDGSVWIPVGASINTGGGNITIGGGTNPVTGYALGDNNSTSTENNARYRGVTVNGTLNAAGGSISILGRGNPSGTNARGVSIGGAISTSGSGTITISGIAKDGSDGLALGDVSVSGTTGTISSENGNITLTGTKDSGSNG
ncbi:MAG: Filamentous hemagglutinin, N-terminal, partial [Proteobacteria bacterium]|nr:Filamentous hemagglutinin, N-terminal [Pseudomonadota bacterium]